MEFRTKVELPVVQEKIGHADRLMLWGSCFAENMAGRLADYKFTIDVNPYGILYNPLSIAKALSELLEGKVYCPEDLRYDREVWYSLMHHSTFSSAEQAVCLDTINRRLRAGAENLRQADWLIFTWGTSLVYEWKEDGAIVGNCHKLPERLFNRRLLDVDEIVACYKELLERIHTENPRAKILFTVSPIRHAKDGLHGNQLNKAVLLLAIDKLCGSLPYCYYFPSYEIVMDELRDYRFYAEDMLHPSEVAVHYIWECFAKTFFSASAFEVMRAWEEVRKALAHRPFDARSEAYRRFLRQILLKIESLQEKFPYLDVQNEKTLCQALLKK